MKKRLLSLFLVFAMLVLGNLTGTASVLAAEMPFEDVQENSWYHDAVSYVYEHNLMKGTSITRFEPNTGMSRAMFITVLGRMSGVEAADTELFPDVEMNTWYSGYVGWASRNEVVNGYPDGTFRPYSLISRQEAASVMVRYTENCLDIVPLRDWEAPKSFADEDDIASWSNDYVQQMRLTGIMTGNHVNNFLPEDTLTRAEAATIIMRLHKMIENLELDEPLSLSYILEGEDFNLLGAWQMYYAGNAITTSYTSTSVNENGDIPFLEGRNTGRKMLYNGEAPIDEFAGDNTYFAFDIRVMNISPDKYPVIRAAYRVSDGSVPALGLVSGTVDYGGPVIATAKTTTEINPKDDPVSGWKTFTVDLANTDDFSWIDDDGEITLSLFADSDSADMEILYFAAFKTVEEADAFDYNDYLDFASDRENAKLGEVNYSEITEGTAQKYTKEVENAKEEILEYDADIDPKSIKGECYYISSINGDDSNDGKSPLTPWKTTDPLTKVKLGVVVNSVLEPGDAVFFERGSEFYPTGRLRTNKGGDYVLGTRDGVTYAAYGSGPKPLFTLAVKFDDGSKTGTWTETDVPNVYVLDQLVKAPVDKPIYYNDICSIAFNEGEAWGVRVMAQDFYNPIGSKTTDAGSWSNGYERFEREALDIESIESVLVNNLEYYYDHNTGKVYLRCNAGNPEDVFETIRLTRYGHAIRAGEEITFDNLAIKYSGRHGLDFGGNNVIVQYCEFAFIGGNLIDYETEKYGESITRMGNALEGWGSCSNNYVHHNYFHQVWDTCLTIQGDSGKMTNILWEYNVMTSSGGTELWNASVSDESENILANALIRNNYYYILRNSFGRVGSPAAENGLKQSRCKMTNVVFENNLIIAGPSGGWSTEGQISLGQNSAGKIFRNNTYIMSQDTGIINRCRKNIAMRIGNCKTWIPYTEQYLQYLMNLGIHIGSEFYYYADENLNNIFPEFPS